MRIPLRAQYAALMLTVIVSIMTVLSWRITQTHRSAVDALDLAVAEQMAAHLEAVQRDQGLAVLVAAALLIAFALGIAALMARRLRSPIRELAEHARRIGNGDLTQSVQTERNDEIGDLFREFEMMGRGLGLARRDLEAAMARAERASNAKSEFLASMSHEIRTPMNGVLGMTSLLLETGLNSRQARFVETIDRSARSLLTIIDDVLDLSKIEAGKLTLHRAPFQLHGTIEEAVDVFAGRAAAKGIDLSCSIAQSVPTSVVGDASRLRQVLTNLVGNAVKFTAEGGVLVRVMTIDGADPGQVRLRFMVQDTGIGVAPHERDSIFEVFTQADSSTAAGFGGSGLGLPIAREIAELLGGSIGVTSEVDVGSTFWFTATFELDKESLAAESPRLFHGRHVVLAVESAALRAHLSERAEIWGMTCTEAATPEGLIESLARLSRNNAAPADALVIETGRSAVLQDVARNHRDLRGVPRVLIMPPGSTPSEFGFAAGDFAANLSKPVRESDLQEALLRALDGDQDVTIRPQAAGRKKKIPARVLLAEDNPINREVMTEMLAAIGCQVTVAEDGTSAVEEFEPGAFDLVLMDSLMPRKDGPQAAREIRRAEQLCQAVRTPIVAVTASAVKGSGSHFFDAGMDDYLSKPFSFDDLRQVVRAWSAVSEEHDGGPREEDRIVPRTSGPEAIAEVGDGHPSTYAPGRAVDPPLLDERAFERLRAAQQPGRPDLPRKLVRLFFDRGAEFVTQLREAVERRDLDAVERAAHLFKSAAANIGASQLGQACGDLEDLAACGQLTSPQQQLESIENIYGRTLVALFRRFPDVATMQQEPGE